MRETGLDNCQTIVVFYCVMLMMFVWSKPEGLYMLNKIFIIRLSVYLKDSTFKRTKTRLVLRKKKKKGTVKWLHCMYVNKFTIILEQWITQLDYLHAVFVIPKLIFLEKAAKTYKLISATLSLAYAKFRLVVQSDHVSAFSSIHFRFTFAGLSTVI